MAEITRERTGELVRGVFAILMPQQEGLPAKEVLASLATQVPPTEFEASTYPGRPNVRRYEKIVRFSTIGPVKAGWLTKNRGLWALTEEGREAYRRLKDPKQFMLEAHRLYRQWADQQPETGEEGVDAATNSADAATTLEEAEEAAWAEIETHLSGMNPYDFQSLVAGLLTGMGYHVAWVAPPGPDKGVDVIAHSDPLGITGPRIKVQVKRSDDRMSVKEIRSFMAVLADGDVGLFVSKGGFTKDAEEEARHQEKRRLMLVDLRRFFDLWVEHYGSIPELQRRLLPLRPVHFLVPRE
ncbi:MAG: Mrr restriction system protein [Burkholderiales bacterium]|nr:Mrr restriction system protein [Burkholderiales bacterium]